MANRAAAGAASPEVSKKTRKAPELRHSISDIIMPMVAPISSGFVANDFDIAGIDFTKLVMGWVPPWVRLAASSRHRVSGRVMAPLMIVVSTATSALAYPKAAIMSGIPKYPVLENMLAMLCTMDSEFVCSLKIFFVVVIRTLMMMSCAPRKVAMVCGLKIVLNSVSDRNRMNSVGSAK